MQLKFPLEENERAKEEEAPQAFQKTRFMRGGDRYLLSSPTSGSITWVGRFSSPMTWLQRKLRLGGGRKGISSKHGLGTANSRKERSWGKEEDEGAGGRVCIGPACDLQGSYRGGGVSFKGGDSSPEEALTRGAAGSSGGGLGLLLGSERQEGSLDFSCCMLLIVELWGKGFGLELMERALFNIASSLGRPLKVDESTLNFTRPDLARFCVEVNVSNPLPVKMHIRLGDKDSFTPLIYENVPYYCHSCLKLGHMKNSCRKMKDPTQSSHVHKPAQTEPVQSDSSIEQIGFSSGTLWWIMTQGINLGLSKGRVLRRLDRVLINQSTLDQYSDIYLYHLGRTSSDHKPLLLDCINYHFSGPRPFRYINAWALNESFYDMVKKAWSSYSNGRGMRGLAIKLKNLKKSIKDWNLAHFGNIFIKVQEAKKAALQAQENFEDEESEVNREACNLANAKLLRTCKIEEAYWSQKANVKWIANGDASTKFFHSYVKGKRRKASIRLLKNHEGKEMVDHNEISSFIVNHFESSYTQEFMGNLEPILCHIPTLITDQDNQNMIKLPQEEEIKAAIWHLNPNSSAEPDGYNGEFFRYFWDIIKVDIISAIQEFFLGHPIPMAFGSTYIILIPKLEGAKFIGDYRPIALSTFFSKIISRILSNRLSPLLDKIISPKQEGFQKGKGIEEHILLTNELMHRLESKVRGGNVMVKLDMAKAFDKISWSYLKKVLKSFGFNDHCIALLLQNLEATHISLLINGSPHGFFKIKRGVKQGDPLSPLLFIIGSEGFSRSLNYAISSGFIAPFKAGKSQVVSHLAFVDDLLVFLKGDLRNMLRFNHILHNYLRASGQEINNKKSKVFCKKSSHWTYKKKLEEALGFMVGSPPFKYLGSTITT
ncbi:unnamed protein product, partial [Cuscuta campestris]